MEKALRRWMAAVVLIMIPSTNAYPLQSHRPRKCHSFLFQASQGRRPAVDQESEPSPSTFGNGKDDVATNQERRQFIGSATTASFAIPLLYALLVGCATPAAAATEDGAIEVIKTPSGLKYLDLLPGTGRTPQYGELLSIDYTGYIKLPSGNAKKYSSEPQRFDRVTDGYLVKHGNGKTIAGLDEGLHTMREGGTRRILIPPKLGFVDSGLGPLPESAWDRDKLNRLLDQMVELSGGTLIYEVTLKSIIVDEADQGYYQDETISPEDFAKLRANMQKNAAEARLTQEALERQPRNADKVM